METLIKQKIDLIAECIFAKIQKTEKESFGLYSSKFGFLLFLFYYSRYSKNKKHKLLAENYAGKLLDRFVERERSHTFCNGFSGILYLFEFLREHDFIDMDVDDIQPLLDDYIVTQMRQDIGRRNYDFLHGALGVGLYFLKKETKSEYIRELIDFLYHTAEKDIDRQTFKWKSVVEFETNRIGYNLSLSHGISSIIIFLSRVVNSGMADERTMEMLLCAVNYILSQQIDFSQFVTCFPAYSVETKATPVSKCQFKSVSKCRLAWCYGDLGIGVALWHAGKAVDKAEWKEKGLEVLLQSTQRRSYNDSRIVDAGICHGSAGVAMIFRRIYFETHREEFKEAYRYWVNQTLNFSRFEDGLAGYKSLVKDGWKCDYSLLTGISGIGLVFLSYLQDDQQEWDELFLLS